ncbi:DEAD/DEAH box helicase [Cupriavidus sp. MP-37]|uniref:DEAD/DEAH box helicase n=1 Tax=Cupriavidus sp. MP-37 TaxID=2884455 RepID=UPI001D0A552B|nr:DEAD/DEAH box helicase [Cupriavidus sp. MP-37]UDM51954.1 DEAD/DEAH box helicase [Cupriavidus sp. MP-37]
MSTFATEVAQDIRREQAFWSDLAELRAVGIRSTLLDETREVTISGPTLGSEALTRLLNSASVFASARDEESKELAQQIAVFASIASSEPAVRQASIRILSDLGNFPGLARLEVLHPVELSFETHMRKGLLKEINSVDMAGKHTALTAYQLELWKSLDGAKATAVSAPTSSGKSFVVLEHLCERALAARRFTAIYVAPTRALLAEIHGKLEKRLSRIDADIRVTTIPVPDPESRPKQIYVLTQERAQFLLSTAIMRGAVDLVISDEAQSLGDDSRGMILQDTLEKLWELNPQATFLFLAPGASGLGLIGETIGLPAVEVKETTLSPVVQNRISVGFSDFNEHLVKLDLVTPRRLEPIGSYQFKRGFALSEDTKLAAVAQELGASGRSLVYATGPKNAEDLTELLALNRPHVGSKVLNDLAKFIEQHIHKQYSLAKYVRQGVAFHYGNMPSLLREGIEAAFRGGELDYLCCTTTLFQGVNLPARNVFIDTPTRGRGEPLDEADLWNFAGRAGRLGEEVVGNVFLVNYENWETQPLTERKPFAMKAAFKETVEGDFDAVARLLGAATLKAPLSERGHTDAGKVTAAAGLILFRSSQGTLDTLLNRSSMGLSAEQKSNLSLLASSALKSLELPEAVLTTSWMLDPVALASLHKRLVDGIRKREFSKLMPVNPSGDAYKVYNSIFRRLYKHLGGLNLTGEEAKRTRGFVNHVTATALKWMRGEPLTRLVAEAVKYKHGMAQKSGRKAPSQAVIDGAIRDMFALIEKTIRFTLVQWAKAYVDLLKFALKQEGMEDLANQVYDFSLALELGVSTNTGRSLVEFGLSRITAAALASLITDSSLTPEQVREWFAKQPEPLLSQLSPLVTAELRERGLILELPEEGVPSFESI